MTQAQAVRLEYTPVVKPGPGGQQAFHQDRYDKRYRALFAGTGAGKTFAACAEDIVLAFENPGINELVCAPDYPDVRRILYPIFEEFLGLKMRNWGDHKLVANWHRTDHILEWINGSSIEFMGLDEREPGEGATVNHVHVTEARLVRNWADTWLALKRRLRAKGYQGAIIDTHSPTKELVNEWESGDPRYGVYRWGTRDAHEAGVISTDFYTDMVRSHHGARAQAVLEGQYARPEGLVYSAFDPSLHVAVPPEKHKIERMSYGVDWGYTHAACITAWAWTGGRAHGVEEFWARHKHTSELIEEAKRLEAKWGRGRWWCGHDEPGSVQQFKDSGFRADILPPKKRKVKDGCTRVNDMYHTGELKIAPQMRHLLEEMDMYSNKPDKDEPEDDAPDAPDSMRYGLYGEMRTGKGFAAGS